MLPPPFGHSVEKQTTTKLRTELELLCTWKTEFEEKVTLARESEISALKKASEANGMFQREKQRADDAVSMDV